MMKRIISVILSLFISILSFAQTDVQGEFWGVPFRSNKQTVRSAFSKKATYVSSKDPDKLVFKNGNFGGVLWDKITVSFFRNQFFEIEFSKICKDGGFADYTILRGMLEDKYSALKMEDKSVGEHPFRCWFFSIKGEIRNCLLSCSPVNPFETNDDKLSLAYFETALARLRYNSQNEEL